MKAVTVIDNFLDKPEEVRESAFQSGFGTWRPNKGEVGSSIYDGMSFWGDHGSGQRSIAKAVGHPVIVNSMFFRITNLDTEPAYVHSDREAGDYTCICYLSKHEDNTSGTGLYKHKELGWQSMPSFVDLMTEPDLFDKLKKEMVDGSDKYWDMTHFVEGKWNRGFIFKAPLFHARLPKNGFGSSFEDGRLVWVAHFDLE